MSAPHPIMAAALAPFAPAADTYRGWAISFDRPPIPVRDFDWSAPSPDYDASYEGPEDGWVASGAVVHGATRDAVVAEVDAWIEENA